MGQLCAQQLPQHNLPAGKGRIHSLNAAVAAAVIMYEAVRQRDGYCEKRIRV